MVIFHVPTLIIANLNQEETEPRGTQNYLGNALTNVAKVSL